MFRVSEVQLQAKRPLVVRGLSKASILDLGNSLSGGLRSVVKSQALFQSALKAIDYEDDSVSFPETIEVSIVVAHKVRFRVERLRAPGVWNDPIWVGILSCESPYLADKISSDNLRRWFFGSRLVCKRESVPVLGKNGKQRQKKIRSAPMEEVLKMGFELDPIRRAKLFLEVFRGDVSLRPLFTWELVASFARRDDGFVLEDIKAVGTCVPTKKATKRSARESIGPALFGATVTTPLSFG